MQNDLGGYGDGRGGSDEDERCDGDSGKGGALRGGGDEGEDLGRFDDDGLNF